MADSTSLSKHDAPARSSSTASQWLLHRLGMLPVLVVLYLPKGIWDPRRIRAFLGRNAEKKVK